MVVTVIFIIFLVGLLFWLRSISEKVFIRTNRSVTVNIIEEHLKKKTSFNILLLGYGGDKHDGTYLTDSMIIVRIDPTLKKTTLISIPRDIWIKLPIGDKDGIYRKINAAYAIGIDDANYPNKPARFKGVVGGGNLAKYAINTVTGLTVERFVAINFQGFQNTIDTLGGIDVTVEKTFDDFEYPVAGREDDLCGAQPSDIPELIKIATVEATKAFPCRYEHLHFDAGITHMDGETALKYVRSRHSLQDGTDFGRSQRQRNLLLAVKQKVLNIGFIPKIPAFISSLQDNVRTDLAPYEIKTFLQQVSELAQYQNDSFAITDQNLLMDSFSEDGQWILVAKSGQDRWDIMQASLSAILNSNPLMPSAGINLSPSPQIRF